MKDVKTVLGYLEGAQTIVALYESPEGPTSHEFAFNALAEILAAPELLRAQLRLKEGHETVMLIGMEPNGPVVVIPVRGV